MKKCVFVLLFFMFFVNCDNITVQVSDDIMQDCGKIKIGTNLYLKKIRIFDHNGCSAYSDNIYFIVDENDNLITSGISINTLESHGKIAVNHSTMIFK